MPDLQPISSEKDILAEAASVVSSNFNTTPTPQSVPQPQPATVAAIVQDVTPAQSQQPIQPVQMAAPAPTPAPTPAPAPMSYRPPVATSQSVGSTASINYTPNVYSYTLPATSYVFAWLYIISAVVVSGYLAYFLYILGQYSQYSSYSSSSSVSSATSQYFGSIILPLLLIIAACVAVFIFIRSNTKTSRFIAMGIAGLLTAYQIYWATQLFSGSGYYASSTWSMLWAYYSVFIIPFLPYLLLPIATIIYLVTSKAARAYNRIF